MKIEPNEKNKNIIKIDEVDGGELFKYRGFYYVMINDTSANPIVAIDLEDGECTEFSENTEVLIFSNAIFKQ